MRRRSPAKWTRERRDDGHVTGNSGITSPGDPIESQANVSFGGLGYQGLKQRRSVIVEQIAVTNVSAKHCVTTMTRLLADDPRADSVLRGGSGKATA